MGLFGFGKKTVKSYFYGKIPAYTSKEELPDDVDTLKKMGLYYRLEYLDRNTNYTPAFDCLSKGYQLDKEHKDLDIPRYLGVMYYNGNGVLQDIKKGREILRQYLEPTLLKETDHSIIATSAIKEF